QSRARAALRDSHPIRIPSTLLGLLSEIPRCPPEGPSKGSSGGSSQGPPDGAAAGFGDRVADGDGGNRGRQSRVR
ncbi:RNA polymerase subunit sigma-70, partial [Mycolicibacterium smegmatis]